MSLTREQVKTVQVVLNSKGFRGENGKPLVEDGIWGKQTSFAVRAFKRSKGLLDRDYIGPITWAMLTGDEKPLKDAVANAQQAPKWYNELLKMIGKNETRDNAHLRAWLRSDGATIGDPAKIPWCGDAVETSIKLALPDEKVPDNPYAAINWMTWGKEVEPQLGAILIFWRGSPRSWQGHIGFYAGESATNYYVLGGNQSNSVTIAPLAKGRLRPGGTRWPLTGQKPTGRKVAMTGGTVSVNEA